MQKVKNLIPIKHKFFLCKKKLSVIFTILILHAELKSQAVFSSAGTYTQDFGTTAIGAGGFVNNSTFINAGNPINSGWYISHPGNFIGTINITGAAPVNSGGQYAYTCNGGTDLKFGTRPSNGSGGGPCDATPNTCGHGIGLRLTNNMGAAIQSINVSFDAFQFSLAQNGNTPNPLKFYYQTGPSGSQTSVTGAATGGVSVVALDYIMPNNSAACCSSQINGYPCTVTISKSACIVVNIAMGDEIMLVWWDPNNSNNDPHIGIDNISVTAYSDNACLTVLPVELVSFEAKDLTDKVELNWITASERNNDYFTVERSEDGVTFEKISTVKAAGNSKKMMSYKTYDSPLISDVTYYRLKQTDLDKTFTYFHIIALDKLNSNKITDLKIVPNPSENGLFAVSVSGFKTNDDILIEIFDHTGLKVTETTLQENNSVIDLSSYAKGMYFVKANINGKIITRKVISR